MPGLLIALAKPVSSPVNWTYLFLVNICKSFLLAGWTTSVQTLPRVEPEKAMKADLVRGGGSSGSKSIAMPTHPFVEADTLETNSNLSSLNSYISKCCAMADNQGNIAEFPGFIVSEDWTTNSIDPETDLIYSV